MNMGFTRIGKGGVVVVFPLAIKTVQGLYAEFMIKFDLEILLRKTTARLNFKIDLVTVQLCNRLFCLNFRPKISLKN